MALVIPFTIFYYEQDHDTGVYGKVFSSASWGFGTFTVIAPSGLMPRIGRLRRPPRVHPRLASRPSTPPPSPSRTDASPRGLRRVPGLRLRRLRRQHLRDVVRAHHVSRVRHRAHLGGFVGAFMVFAGVGVSAIPVDEIKAFLTRPKKVIAKSEHIRIAGKIAEETKSVLEEAREVQREERSARTRKTRRALAKIEKRLASLEDDELTLQRNARRARSRRAVDAHGDGVLWTPAAGVVSAIVSTAWIVHVCVYVFPDQPLGTFLNGFFVALDSVWGLFGTVTFALRLLLSHPVRGEGVREGWVSAAHLHRVPDET